MVIHRKTKHGFNTDNEKKSRGRPKKEYQQESSSNNAQAKYENFLNKWFIQPHWRYDGNESFIEISDSKLFDFEN